MKMALKGFATCETCLKPNVDSYLQAAENSQPLIL